MSATAQGMGRPRGRVHARVGSATAAIALLAGLVTSCGGGGGTSGPTGPTQTLSVLIAGNGSGLVVSSPSGINCTITAGATTGTCAAKFAAGAAVTLTASGAFSAWSGPCSGSATNVNCALALPTDQTVTAGFGTITTLTAISALVTGTGAPTMGLVVIGLPTFVLSVVPPSASQDRGRVSAATATGPGPVVPITGQLHIIGKTGVIALAGTYDSNTSSKLLCLTQPTSPAASPCSAPPGGFWQFSGTIDATGNGSGTFSGPDPTTPGASAPGAFRVQPGSVSNPPKVFCGQILDPNLRQVGRWVVTRNGSALGGYSNQTQGFFEINGTLVGAPANSLQLTASGGGPAEYQATATVNAAGDSIGGVWSSTSPAGGPSGTWGATIAACNA